jgi:hypothetical protein
MYRGPCAIAIVSSSGIAEKVCEKEFRILKYDHGCNLKAP